MTQTTTLILLLKQGIQNWNVPPPIIQKRVLLLKIEILTNTIKKQLARSLRNNLSMNKKEKTSSDHTKLNIRLRCAEIGSFSGSASSKINAHLPMVIMNYIKRYIYHKTTKLSPVHNFILHPIAPMETGANFCILNSTYIAANQLAMRTFSMRM